MSADEKIIDEIMVRLNGIANTDVEEGFFSQYQDELDPNEKKLVVQVRSNGPAQHTNNTQYSSKLNVLIIGIVGMKLNQTGKNLRALHKQTRLALFPKDERQRYKGLASSVKELEATPYREPKDSQKNAYFILPLEFTYTEK